MKNTLQTTKVIVLAVLLTAGLSYVFADWTDPVSPPPTCIAGNPGCDAPIHVGRVGQTKDGNLIIQGLTAGGAAATNGLIVANGRVGIGTVSPTEKLEVSGKAKATEFCLPGSSPTGGCIGVWPTGGGGGGIGGSGTANYLPKFTAATTIGNSKVSQSATTNHVGINLAPTSIDATAYLDVNGQVRIRGGDPDDGEVLTASGSTGLATWEPVAKFYNSPEFSMPAMPTFTSWMNVPFKPLTVSVNKGSESIGEVYSISGTGIFSANAPNSATREIAVAVYLQGYGFGVQVERRLSGSQWQVRFKISGGNLHGGDWTFSVLGN